MAELLLQRHDQFDCVQGVGAQILDELGVGRYLVRIDAQLFDNNVFYSLFRSLFSSHEFAPFLFLSLSSRHFSSG